MPLRTGEAWCGRRGLVWIWTRKIYVEFGIITIIKTHDTFFVNSYYCAANIYFPTTGPDQTISSRDEISGLEPDWHADQTSQDETAFVTGAGYETKRHVLCEGSEGSGPGLRVISTRPSGPDMAKGLLGLSKGVPNALCRSEGVPKRDLGLRCMGLEVRLDMGTDIWLAFGMRAQSTCQTRSIRPSAHIRVSL